MYKMVGSLAPKQSYATMSAVRMKLAEVFIRQLVQDLSFKEEILMFVFYQLFPNIPGGAS